MNKNDDLNDDFETGPDNDLDTDFGEFDQGSERGSFSDLIKKNPAVKIGLVIAALLVIVGAITLFGGPKVKGPDSSVTAGNDLKEAPGTKQLSPEMQNVIEEVNRKTIEEAQRQGTSAIPQPIDTPKEVLSVPADDAAAEDPLNRWRQMQDERQKAQQAEQSSQKQTADPAKEQASQALSTAMGAQMAEILSGKKVENLKTMKITDLQQLLAARQQQAQQQNPNNNTLGSNTYNNQAIDPTTGQPLPPAKILLPAGAIEYSQLLIEANSDIPGPIVAMLVSGPFAGSRALGTFTRQEKLLVLQFNTLVNKKGISIPINAYALDPDSTLTGLATDVDNRYWERIVLPAAADFIQGVADAYANQQGDTTVVTGDVVVQSKPPINYQEQLATGLSKGAERVGDILQDEGDKTEPQVRVRAGTPMGILFMSPITDQDFMANENNPTTARTLAAQQQQQTLWQQQLQANQSAQNPLYLIQGMGGLQNGQTTANGTTTGYPTIPYSTNGTSTTGTGTSNQSLNSNIFSTQQYLGQGTNN